MNDERQSKAMKNHYERSNSSTQINRDLRKKFSSRNAYGMKIIFFHLFLININVPFMKKISMNIDSLRLHSGLSNFVCSQSDEEK